MGAVAAEDEYWHICGIRMLLVVVVAVVVRSSILAGPRVGQGPLV